MWVFRELRGEGWEVGYYLPDGTWFRDGTYQDKKAASARVHYLNGGSYE